MAAAALSDEGEGSGVGIKALCLPYVWCVGSRCGCVRDAVAQWQGVLARTGPEVVSSDWDGLGGGALTRACGRCDEQTEWLTFIGMAVASALLPLLM